MLQVRFHFSIYDAYLQALQMVIDSSSFQRRDVFAFHSDLNHTELSSMIILRGCSSYTLSAKIDRSSLTHCKSYN